MVEEVVNRGYVTGGRGNSIGNILEPSQGKKEGNKKEPTPSKVSN